jgi:protein-S-isoprenylcysteine O-methyltransferase Ste14
MALRETYEKQGAFLFRWRSYLPLLIAPVLVVVAFDSQYTHRLFGERFDNVWEGISIGVSFLGFIVRCLVAGYVPRGTSGRNTQSQVAEALNMTGIYSVVRNPLYLGNYLIILGLLLFIQVWWFVLLGTAIFWIFYERIIFTEEEFLRQKFGAAYLEWSSRTPVFIPKFRNWKKPVLPFSWKTVLRREHSTLFGMISAFTALGISADLFIEKDKEIDLFWWIFFASGLGVYLFLRFLKKKTKLLNEQGR